MPTSFARGTGYSAACFTACSGPAEGGDQPLDDFTHGRAAECLVHVRKTGRGQVRPQAVVVEEGHHRIRDALFVVSDPRRHAVDEAHALSAHAGGDYGHTESE